MGAGASLQSSQASAEEAMCKMNIPKGTSEGIKAQIKNDLINNAMFVEMAGAQASTFRGANPPEGAPVPSGVGALYEGVDDEAKKLVIGAAVSKWHCYNIMMGACLLAKHHKKINAYFEACGPVPTPQGMQVTRKSMSAKLSSIGKWPPEDIETALDWFMTHVGKEQNKSKVTAEVKHEAIKKLVVDESSANNWDDETCRILDAALCPKAAGIKANLDILSDGESGKAELGISRHEMRMFWVNDFACNGEEPTLKKLASCMYWVTGEGEPYFGTPDAIVKE